MLYVYFWVRNLFEREEGQDLAEYAILLGLIALVVMVAVILLGTSLSDLFGRMGAEVADWVPGG